MTLRGGSDTQARTHEAGNLLPRDSRRGIGGLLLAKIGKCRLQRLPRLLGVDAGFEAAANGEAVVARIEKALRGGGGQERKPDIVEDARLHAAEAFLSDADNLKPHAVQGEPSAQHGGISGEAAHPEGVTDDGNGALLIALVVGVGEQASDGRADAQDGQAAGGDPLRAELLGRRAGGGVIEDGALRGAPDGHGEEIHLSAGRLAKTLELGVAEVVVIERRARKDAQPGIRKRDQLPGLRHRQGAQDQRVDEREGRRACADGQGQRDDGGGRDRRLLQQNAGAEAEIAEEGFEPGEELGVAARFAQGQLVPEAALGRAGGIGGVHALANQFSGAGFHVELELVPQIAIQTVAAKHIRET